VAGQDWLGIELRHLAALEAIAREGSFARAAASLGYTRSAVSSQVATLERIVGARLVDRSRGPNGVTLTDSGAALLDHALGIRASLEEARERLALHGTGEQCVRIGFVEGVGGVFLPPLVRAAADADPEPLICPREGRSTAQLLDLVEAGELDLALVVLPTRRTGIRTQLILRDPYDLLLPPDHELAEEEGPVGLGALRELSLVIFGAEDQVRRLERALDQVSVLPPERLELTDTPTIGALVRAGVAAALVPRLVAEACPDLPARPVEPALPPRLIAVAHTDGRPLREAEQVLLRALREHASDREEPGADLTATVAG
jgi:molybdate transport repressor ModE-like protein